MVIVRGGGKQASKMKEREPDSNSAGAPVPKMARSTEPHVQTGELFPRVQPQQQEYHGGKPRWLWSAQFGMFVDSWELGGPGERGPSGEEVDTSDWSREQLA